jgi:hypothetical protein
VLIELALTDRDERGVFAEIARVHFTLQTGPARSATASTCRMTPLTTRPGFASRGTFGPLRPQEYEAAARLRATFPRRGAEADLAPAIEDL